MNPRSASAATSRAHALADVEAALAPDDPAFDRRRERAHPRAAVGRTGDNGVEDVTDPVREQQRRGGLAHLPLDLFGGALLRRAVRRQRPQLVDRVGRRPIAERRLQPTLGVGDATIRRGRVRVVTRGQTEMSLYGRCARFILHERGEIGGEPLGQHREDLGRCRPKWCWCGRDRQSASRAGPARRRRQSRPARW